MQSLRFFECSPPRLLAPAPTAHETNGSWLGTFVTTGNEVQEGSAVQIASVSVSPVRIRTAWSMPYTKILPSPIFSVFADEMIVSMTLST